MAQPKKNLYHILGVPHDANDIDIGLAYEKRVEELQRAVPPDPSAEAFVRQAYEVLSNPKRRAAYDASLVTAAEKAAAAEQARPDLVIEASDGEPRSKPIKGAAIVAAIIVALLAMYLALRPSRLPEPGTKTETPAPAAEAPKAPPPPKPLNPAEMLKHATTSGGQLVSLEMSGRSVPIGIALAIDQSTMVTTCHGIQAGRKLVVLVGKDTFAADPSITDETLDLCKLSVPGMVSVPLQVAAAEPKPGDKVFVEGVNAAGEFALTEGTIRKLVKTPQGNVLDLSVPIAATASGGAVFDQFGKLVGIAVTPHKYGPGLNVALPASWLPQIRSRGRAQ